MRILKLDAGYLTELGFQEDTPDEVFLEAIGNEGRCLITKDLKIRTNPRLKATLKAYGVGAFFLGGSDKSAREIIEQVVTANRMIEERAMTRRKPFAFIVRPGGRKVDELSLD